MPRRPGPKKTRLKPSPRVLAALASLEIDCDCKPSLIPSCIAGALQGCRERRHCGTCPCRPRYLPDCLLSSGQGCPRHREGKTCQCLRLYMPECLALGCAARRRGRRCECPRTPGEPCCHVHAKAGQLRLHSAEEAQTFADAWAEQLWLLLPDEYADRPAPSKGVTAQAGEASVNLMAVREKMGLSLWHAEDERWPQGETTRRQAAGLRRLLGGRKAVA